MGIKRVSCGLIFLFSLLFAPVLTFLFPNHKEVILTMIELGAEVAILINLSLFLLRGDKNFTFENISIYLSILSLFLADSIYNANLLNMLSDNLEIIADLLYSFFMFFLLAFLIKKLNIDKRKPNDWVLACCIVFSLKMALVYKFLLSPYYPTGVDLIWKINGTIYLTLSSIIFSLIIPFLIRTIDRPTFWFLNAILLLLTSNFAISYHDAFIDGSSFSWAELAWSTTLVGLAWLSYVTNKSQEVFITKDIKLAPLVSIRSLLPLAIFSANILLLVGILALSMPILENAVNVSILLFLLFIFWTSANEFSIWLANDLGRVLLNMFKTNELLSTDGIVEVELEMIQTNNPIFEISKILDSYNSLITQTNNAMKLALETNKNAMIASIARQVSHDIRSPLAALSMTLEVTQSLPEDIRWLMRSSVNRIRDIANNLVAPIFDRKDFSCADEENENHVFLLSSVIENLISEKRMQFRSKIGIEIEAEIGVSSYGIFSRINLTEFKRILSNLINNGVEAIDSLQTPNGKVSIQLQKNDHQVIILVVDNGIGIPHEILEKIGERGVSYGKTNGSGLGLYHARNTLVLWTGSLEIDSIHLLGTTVKITLPLVEPPSWFIQRLFVLPTQKIVILDDDMSIHQIWHGRFHGFTSDLNIELISLSTPKQLRNWVTHHLSCLQDVLFLIDYELIGFTETGLFLIQELNLQTKAVLVTSHFEELSIIQQCEDENIQLIPKGMVPFVPIEYIKK